MNDLRKVNSIQLYYLWRNFAVALLCMAATITGTHILPYYMAPVVSLLLCGFLYTMMWNNENSEQPGCMVVPQVIFYSLLFYTFLSILLVIIHALDLAKIPAEIMFFNTPYIASLTLMPISLLVTLYTLLFSSSMPACKKCMARAGSIRERGYFGYVTAQESKIQLRNLTVLFALLTAYIWWYYLDRYIDVNQNGRDWYVFVWIIIMLIVLDEVYFMMRYYNLYLDFQEHNEIITPDEIRDMAARTYIRYYVICGEYIYIDRNATDRITQNKHIFDTPFITKKTVNGIQMIDVKRIIEKMSGHKGGELKFYYGRHIANNNKVSVLRYFYFLDGNISDYSDIEMPGEWIHFDTIKRTYQENPVNIGANALNDLSRLFTIILTERDFDENGMRKNLIKSYKRNITLADVRKTELDLQDDKWIHIAHFNSDLKFFKLKKWFRSFIGKKRHQTSE
ncbi:MAG: hypothetical protein NC095_09290 [Muribaculum sp.]|nr:hypothetical protein [Muribaculum sp.]